MGYIASNVSGCLPVCVCVCVSDCACMHPVCLVQDVCDGFSFNFHIFFSFAFFYHSVTNHMNFFINQARRFNDKGKSAISTLFFSLKIKTQDSSVVHYLLCKGDIILGAGNQCAA